VSVAKRAERRPRVLVFNQYYWPGVEATAHLLSELCAELASDYDITVITGSLRLPEAKAGRSIHRGVEIVRVRSSVYDRRRLLLRAANYITYLTQSLQAGLRQKKPDVVLCMTDPPFLADTAVIVARRFRVPLVVITQDVFPEIAVELGRLENPAVVALLRWMVAFYLRRADRVVAIGETMRDRLIIKGAPPERIRVIANWADAEAIQPLPHDNPWAEEQGLDGKFVVMHSGNVGHAQNLDMLVRASTFMRDLEDLAILIIGTGARHAELVELADRLSVDHVRFLPYQEREVLSQSLSAAHVHVVGLAHGLSGYIVPSRLYGILAAGRPVIVAADPESETARVVTRIGCGVVVPPGRHDLLAKAIRSAHDGEFDLERMGELGREYLMTEANRDHATARYRALLEEVLP
jgi:colanic acid biosynthesis glycosyl transferase WcaI